MTTSVKKKQRPTGIDSIGNIPWGTHICQFYENKKDLSRILVPFFKSGLKNNDMCIWVTSEPLTVEEAKEALKKAINNLDNYENKGQIQIIDSKDFYRQALKFDGWKTSQQLLIKEREAIDGGFDGVRISGNVSWLKQDDWKSFVQYEAAVDTIMRRHKIIAICCYPSNQYQQVGIIDIVSNHRHILIRRENRTEFIYNNGHRYISELRNDGSSYSEISQKVGLSRQRVAQILRNKDRSRNKKQPSQDSSLLSVSDAAQFLNVHANTVRRWSDSGILPGYRIGSRNDRRFLLKDLQKYLYNMTNYE